MTASVVLMPHTGLQLNVVGEPVGADGLYGFSDGLHTVSVHTQNLKGRVYLEASLAMSPGENDWFPIWLTEGTPYVEFPQNPFHPTGTSGDSSVEAFNFRANILWIRARLDRSYLKDPKVTESDIAQLGSVRKIVLSR